MTTYIILLIISLILAVLVCLGVPSNKIPLLAIAVVLMGVALLIKEGFFK